MRSLISWLQINFVVPWAMRRQLIKGFLPKDLFKLYQVGRRLHCGHLCWFCLHVLSTAGRATVEDDLPISPEDCRVMFVEPVVADEHGRFTEIGDEHSLHVLMV